MTHSERSTGICVSYAGEAKDNQYTVSTLSNDMARPENGEIPLSGLPQPKVKTGLAFMLAQAINAKPKNIEQALAAVEFVIPALEISSDGAAVYYVTGGRPVRANHCDWETLGVVLEQNGEIAGIGAGAQIHGHPAEAIMAATQEKTMPAGSLVLASGITPAVDVAAQDNILARVQDLGSLSIRFY